MKTPFLLSLIFAMLPVAASATGAISGGGGKSIVCRDPGGNITFAQVLDLYEGEVLYRLPSPSTTQSFDIIVQNALNTIPASIRSLYKIFVDSVQQGLNIQNGLVLQPVDDALVVAVPKGCQAEQLANYFTDQNILVSGEIWDHLDAKNRAALILHEAIYRVERIQGATTSLRARHVVASLFATNTNWVDPDQGLPQISHRLMCFAYDTNGMTASFAAFLDAGKIWNLQFGILGRGMVMSLKTFNFAYDGGNASLDLTEAKTHPVFKGENKIGTSESNGGPVQSLFENGDRILITKKWEMAFDQKGRPLPGLQTPRYYFSWTSVNDPGMEILETPVECLDDKN